MSVAPGWAVPVPGCNTLNARPEAVLVASAGGLATSGGAGSGFVAWPMTDTVATAVNKKVRMGRCMG